MTLREELLDGCAVALAGGVPEAVRIGLAALGARVEELGAQEAEGWVKARLPLDAVVYDAREAFARGGQPGLRAATDGAWDMIRAVATAALIPEQRGKVILVGPRSDGAEFATATRAALENLARTLSVEWARYGITATMIAPGPTTTDEELAELISFLLSLAGDYFSGCRFELGGVPGPHSRS
jgi:NAD(P)-dependent dehydrogenase (short-subunit alcohol dehydrogenase family)